MGRGAGGSLASLSPSRSTNRATWILISLGWLLFTTPTPPLIWKQQKLHLIKKTSTHPELLQTGDGLCGEAGQQIVEEAEAGEGVVDPIEDPRFQLLDHISLQVQGCDRPKVAQLPTPKVP